jgi:uncharacterized protein (DUF2141 family)
MFEETNGDPKLEHFKFGMHPEDFVVLTNSNPGPGPQLFLYTAYFASLG